MFMQPAEVAYAVIGGWLVVVLAHAAAAMCHPDYTTKGVSVSTNTAQQSPIYHEFYRNLVLPAVTGAALVGLVTTADLSAIDWWGAAFFVLYNAANFALYRNADGYGRNQLLVDLIGVAIALVMNETGLFTGTIESNPLAVFLGILAVPILGAWWRCLRGHAPRVFPSVIGVLGALIGLAGVWIGCPWMEYGAMLLLIVALILYVRCGLAGGGNVKIHNCVWCTDWETPLTSGVCSASS